MPHQTHLGAENSLYLRTKCARSKSIRKFCLILPHQTKIENENHLNSPKKYSDQRNYLRRRCQEHFKPKNDYKSRAKHGYATKATFLKENPEPTGNPLKNPKKQHKNPLPPPVAGWAGLAGLAGLKELDFDHAHNWETPDSSSSMLLELPEAGFYQRPSVFQV